jgi:hypothetical protein
MAGIIAATLLGLCGCGPDTPSAAQLQFRASRQALESQSADINDESESMMEFVIEDDFGQLIPVVLYGDDVGGRGRAISDDEHLAWQKLHEASIDHNPPSSPTTTERALSVLAARPSDEWVLVTLALDDPGFDFRRFGLVQRQDAQDQQVLRDDLVRERQIQLAESSQKAVLERIAAAGAKVEYVYWIDNSINVEAPARQISEMAKWPEVISVTYEEPSTLPVTLSSGLDIRNQTFVGNLHTAPSPGPYKGANVTVAVIESTGALDGTANDFVNRNHDGFDDSAGGTNRITAVYDCRSGACALTASTGSGNHHSTSVTWAVGGSIEQGQDTHAPTFPGLNTTDQKIRSGVATESKIQFYFQNSFANAKKAIEKAVAQGASIINMSFGGNPNDPDGSGPATGQECQDLSNPETYDNNLNAALRNALIADVLPVNAAGNWEDSGDTCSATYPAWRPHVLPVGAANTVYDADLNGVFLWNKSSRGKVPVGTGAGRELNVQPTVNLIANGAIEYYFINDSDYEAASSRIGTSTAAPIVAGSAALLKEAFSKLGFSTSATSARMLLTNMLLMG